MVKYVVLIDVLLVILGVVGGRLRHLVRCALVESISVWACHEACESADHVGHWYGLRGLRHVLLHLELIPGTAAL